MKIKNLFLCVLITAVYVACGGGQQVKQADTAKTETQKQAVETAAPVVQASGFDTELWVKTSNEQLSRVPFDGFAYKSSEVPAQKWDKWAVTAAPVISGIVSKIPDGYVLQITGHTDGSGPEDPQAQKPGNVKISTDRAKSVYNSLRKKGITSPKMTYKGAGSSEPLSGVDSRDAAQRRVTFNIVAK